jgi:hypothetical protein
VTRDWQEARDGFYAAAQRGPLSADDLDAWADAAWWLGLVDESIAAATEAYRLFLADGRPQRAATSAVGVAVNHFLRGDGEEGAGWVSRAQRLMEGEPESAEQGFLRYLLGWKARSTGPTSTASSPPPGSSTRSVAVSVIPTSPRRACWARGGRWCA